MKRLTAPIAIAILAISAVLPLAAATSLGEAAPWSNRGPSGPADCRTMFRGAGCASPSKPKPTSTPDPCQNPDRGIVPQVTC